MYTIRKNCIFCNNKLSTTYFYEDKKIPVAVYCVDTSITDDYLIPYNIYICSCCNTVQTKYLGDLKEIYKYNHADGTGSIMGNLHNKVCDIMLKYKDNINNIIEIGSSKGILADLILNKLDNIEYNIIDPAYIGSSINKTIYNNFYENINDNNINANTIIISHVFEHFYNPIEIINKINKNTNIDNFILVWPDLDYYLENNVLHVLNTEHTFYVSNKYIKNLFKLYNFTLIEETFYEGHSVIFYFKRSKVNLIENNITIEFKNNIETIPLYFNNIDKIITYFNNVINDAEIPVYIWPCSIHTIFLTVFGLNINKISNILDNSPLKINKKVYGLDKICLDFNEVLKKNEKSIIILNGGIFNKEVEHLLLKTNIQTIKYI